MALPEKPVTYSDHVGVSWLNDLVHERLTFDPGELRGEASARVAGVTATVTTDAGPSATPLARDGDTLTLRLPAGRLRFVVNTDGQ